MQFEKQFPRAIYFVIKVNRRRWFIIQIQGLSESFAWSFVRNTAAGAEYLLFFLKKKVLYGTQNEFQVFHS